MAELEISVKDLVHQEVHYSVYQIHSEEFNYLIVNNHLSCVEGQEEVLPEAIAKCKYYSDLLTKFKEDHSLNSMLGSEVPDESKKH